VARTVLVGAGAASLLFAGLLAGTGRAPSAAASDLGVSVEVDSGPFAGLELTVSQTRNLTSQVVLIEWENAPPTIPSFGTPSHSYLQIMQCWGVDPAGTEPSVTPGLEPDGSAAADYGPDREHCQYGAVGTREVDPGTLVDPVENLEPNYDCTGDLCQQGFVPFASVTGADPIVSPAGNIYFDVNTSNEIPIARTRSNGIGQAYFEVQTLRQAPGLGCGFAQRTASGVTGRPCWLVIVPRNDREVDGQLVGLQEANRELFSSPLSATNWRNRIVIPLTFAAIGNVCPIGGKERRILGTEIATDAMTRWQPTLCADGTRIFNYSQVPAPVVSNQLQSDDPSLALVDEVVQDVDDAVYAPLLAGGLTFASLIERQVRGTESVDVLERAGERMPALRLNARLAAKLLTQSYRGGLADPDTSDKSQHLSLVDANGRPQVDGTGNLLLAPRNLAGDEEFLALNPDFRDYPVSRMPVADVVLPTGSSATNQLVWRWIMSDPEAKAFMEGAPDEWGMRVNPYYRNQGLNLAGEPRSDFPKRDEICRDPIPVLDQNSGEITYPEASRLCTNGAHPYAQDYLGSAGRPGAVQGQWSRRRG
jgi:hypothetical protein